MKTYAQLGVLQDSILSVTLILLLDHANNVHFKKCVFICETFSTSNPEDLTQLHKMNVNIKKKLL